MKLWGYLVITIGFGNLAFGAPVPPARPLVPGSWDSWEPVAASAGGVYSLVDSGKRNDCPPFRQLFVDAKLGDATFPVRQQFWYAPDAALGDAKNRALPKISGGEITFSNETLKFGLVPNKKFEIRAVHTVDKKECVYDHWWTERYLAYADGLIDPVVSAFKKSAKEIAALPTEDFKKFCDALRSDKWFPADSAPYPKLCSLKEKTEANQEAIAKAFATAIATLELQKLGVRDPVKAYGPTWVGDRMYRRADNRAVFGGFDPVEMFKADAAQYAHKARCEDQRFSKEQCRQFTAVLAAFVIQYHAD